MSTIKKKNKQAHYEKCFERNWNIKNTSKRIKYFISLKTVGFTVPTVLSLSLSLSLGNSDTITNPYDIATTFNNYFASIAETTKKYEIFT